MDHDSSVPINSNECPGQRARDDRCVDEASITRVAEVERRQVDEIENEHDLGDGEVRVDEQHDPGEMQQVVHDEVTAN